MISLRRSLEIPTQSPARSPFPTTRGLLFAPSSSLLFERAFYPLSAVKNSPLCNSGLLVVSLQGAWKAIAHGNSALRGVIPSLIGLFPACPLRPTVPRTSFRAPPCIPLPSASPIWRGPRWKQSSTTSTLCDPAWIPAISAVKLAGAERIACLFASSAFTPSPDNLYSPRSSLPSAAASSHNSPHQRSRGGW